MWCLQFWLSFTGYRFFDMDTKKEPQNIEK